MKNLISKTLLGSDAKWSLLVVFALLIFVILGCRGNRGDTNVAVNTSTSPSPTASVAVSTPKPTFTKADASKSEMPSDPELQEIAKTTLLDFNEAVQDADFSDFYKKIAKPWQKQTNAEDLKTTFQGFIDKDIDIGNISPLEADFSPDPLIEKEIGYKTLKLEGRYPTSPRSTKFVLHYIPEGKDWKLSRIEVDTTGK